MSDLVLEPVQGRSKSASFINDPNVRSIGLQLIALILVVLLGWMFVENARDNLAAQKIATGFGFLDNTAGFGISQTLIPYSETSTYGRAFLVGLLNTILVAVVGIFLATIIGFLVGIGRLSKNFVVRLISTTYVEVLRNLPPLFQILFWYLAVLSAMPSPRQSISIFGEVFISNRGLIIPRPLFGEGTGLVLWAFGAALLAVILIGYWARGRQEETGRALPHAVGGPRHSRPRAARRHDLHRLPHHLRAARAEGLQLRRRRARHPRIRRAHRGARHLYGRLHRRECALRHHGGEPRPDRGGAFAAGCATARHCVSWSSRRPCG